MQFCSYQQESNFMCQFSQSQGTLNKYAAMNHCKCTFEQFLHLNLCSCLLETNAFHLNNLCFTIPIAKRGGCVVCGRVRALVACLSSGVSTWKVRSMTVVHCRQRMINVLGLGRSVFISWHSDQQPGREQGGR